jgi:hypothetical protein|tara:strand:+ start:16112 stop:16510 length:399 start_codon:yes stop_codon:yes gene_type:complete
MIHGNLNHLTNKVMMIINSTKKFFWTKIQKNLSFRSTITKLLLVCLFLFISCKKNEDLNLASLKTQNGWGYVITLEEKIIIKQTVIPVISENKSFKTEEEALKVGQLVLEKLNSNLSPTVTKKDLLLLSIKI